MNKLAFLYSKSLLHYLWAEFQLRYRFKYLLPKVTETVLDGIRLDLSSLSLKARNRILMGIYERHEKEMCEQFLLAKDAVLEIGGAIGYIGLLCQKKIGIQTYFTFEANPQTFDILLRNYRMNQVEAVAWNAALGPQDGFIELQVSNDFWENSVLPLHDAPFPYESVKVPAVTLETMLKKVGREVNVLIIDVEGAEQYLDAPEIPIGINKIIMELHPRIIGAEKSYALVASLIQRGFQVVREMNSTFVFIKPGS